MDEQHANCYAKGDHYAKVCNHLGGTIRNHANNHRHAGVLKAKANSSTTTNDCSVYPTITIQDIPSAHREMGRME